jgi:hypothetical protein
MTTSKTRPDGEHRKRLTHAEQFAAYLLTALPPTARCTKCGLAYYTVRDWNEPCPWPPGGRMQEPPCGGRIVPIGAPQTPSTLPVKS